LKGSIGPLNRVGSTAYSFKSGGSSGVYTATGVKKISNINYIANTKTPGYFKRTVSA